MIRIQKAAGWTLLTSLCCPDTCEMVLGRARGSQSCKRRALGWGLCCLGP